MIDTTKFIDPAYRATLLKPLFGAAKDDYTPGARVASVVLGPQGAGVSADCAASGCCQQLCEKRAFLARDSVRHRGPLKLRVI